MSPDPESRSVRWPRRLITVVVCGLWSGCTSNVAPLNPRPPLITADMKVEDASSPASWYYHPQKPAVLRAKLDLGGGRVLFAGERGERWLLDEKKQEVATAARLAPETLIAVSKMHESGWLFVGQSGTGYEAEAPLAPFVRSSAPVDPLKRVAASGSSIAGIRFDGALIHTENAGVTWRELKKADANFVDVQIADDGSGVAFAVPETWMATADYGKTWRPLQTPGIGALGLARDPARGIVALGATSWFDVNVNAAVPFAARRSGPSEEGYAIKAALPRGPDAQAVMDGRAALLGDRYLELAGANGQWSLWTGPLGAPLDKKPLESADGCSDVRLAGFGQAIYFACFKSPQKEQAGAVELYRSVNGGKSFKAEPYEVQSKLSEFTMAVGQDARLLLTGICPPQDSDRGCAAHGVYHRKTGAKGKKAELAQSALPGLHQVPLAMTFARDGKTAYVVGRRLKERTYTLFVSTDQGRRFLARDIEQLPSPPPEREDRPWYRSRQSVTVRAVLSAGDDGTLAIVFQHDERIVLAVTDEDGRVLSLTEGPGDATLLGGYGTHGLALAPKSRAVWETMDGGVSWQPIGLAPAELCEEGKECNVPIRCGRAGCVVGAELTRVGWRGQADLETGLSGPPGSLDKALLYPRVKTPISCTLADEEWELLEGVTEHPSAYEAAIGDTVWHAAGYDRKNSSVWAYHALSGAKAKVERKTMLAPVRQPGEYAMAAFDQVEGTSALRYRVPSMARGEQHIQDVEVAWDNRFENVVKTVRLRRRFDFRSGDYAEQKDGSHAARPDLVSIGVGGVYLRLHHTAADAQVTYFLDGRSVAEIPPVSWPAAPMSGRTEMIHVGQAHLPIKLVAGGAALTRATLTGSRYDFDSMAIAMAKPSDFGFAQKTGITYVNGRSAFYALAFAKSGSPRSGWAFPVDASGAISKQPVPIPQQLDLADTPLPCDEASRTGTPRVVVPFQPGTRHPVIISHKIEPIRTLLSTDAVLYGTPKSPCVAALAAEAIDMDRRDDRVWMHAIVDPRALDHAWAFRVVFDEAGDKQIAYRRMACTFDPQAEIPQLVFREPGTLANEP